LLVPPLASQPDPAALLDLSVTSDAFDAGSWQLAAGRSLALTNG
jgi:hypothetical protein